MHKITLLTKPDCQRCEGARRTIDKLVLNHATVLVEEIDVTQDPELQQQYGEELPVVLVDDQVRFRKSIDPQALARYFYDEFGEKLIGFN